MSEPGQIISGIIYLGFLFFIGPLSLWLLFNAVTGVGVALALAGLIAVVLPLTSFWGAKRTSGRWLWQLAASGQYASSPGGCR
jgi:hypothetical protein